MFRQRRNVRDHGPPIRFGPVAQGMSKGGKILVWQGIGERLLLR
ncbi:MAG: hypothetical protein WD768_06400 [Phycisphaeraceae bacterium]